MELHIRESLPADLPALVELLNESSPDWPVSTEEMTQQDATRNPEHFFLRLLAESTEGGSPKELLGVASISQDEHAFEPDKYNLRIEVRPAARRQGVGAALYERALAQLSARAAKTLQGTFREDREASRRFAQARGFAEVWRRFESRLDTAGLDLSPLSELEARQAARGLNLRSLAELADDPQRDRQLYELDWTLFQDVPLGFTPSKLPFETWQSRELENPQLSQQASFVALDPARHDSLSGSYVGLSLLAQHPAGFWTIFMTGVLREYRGLGLAKALKMKGAEYVQAHGAGEIRTVNDPPNVAMIGINEALGFVRQPAFLRYQKTL